MKCQVNSLQDMRRFGLRWLVLLGLVVGLSACGRGCGRKDAQLHRLLDRIEEFRLDNGMLWLLVERGDAPVFTGVVQVRVGGIDETPGKAGLAHMFEHMAFKGSREIGTTDPAQEEALFAKIREVDTALGAAAATGHSTEVERLKTERARLTKAAQEFVVPNEVWKLLHDNGAAEVNAFTSKDITGYYARLPTNMLELWMYLSANMVGHPVMREFYAERDVVMEERRTSVDNSPRGRMYEALLGTAFQASPYRIMAIGSMAEIAGLTMADAEQFHAAHYIPGQMVGVLVGRFDRGAAKTAIRKYYGALPARAKQEREFPAEPEQLAERRVEIRFDAGASVMLAYHKPALPDRADYVFDAIQHILCEGETGRLRRRLEQELQLARSVRCQSGSPGGRLENLFLIEAQPLEGHDPEEVIDAIEGELKRLREAPVAIGELAKARTNLQADFLWGLNSNEHLAQQLAYFQSVAGDWRYVVQHATVMATITPEEIWKVAAAYLQPTQRTVTVLRKP